MSFDNIFEAFEAELAAAGVPDNGAELKKSVLIDGFTASKAANT